MNPKTNIDLKEEKLWYKEEISSVIDFFKSSERGLSSEDATRRLFQNGPNSLPQGKESGFAKVFINQFKSPLIYVLIVAGIVIVTVGEFADSVIIFFVLVVNALIGAFQEEKAKKTLRSLRTFSIGKAVVSRDLRDLEINDEEVVVGDIIVVREGEKVPADARVISSQAFKVDESALTGESESVEKNHLTLEEQTEMPDQKNMIFKSTLAVSGSLRAVVVATGKDTFIGKISTQISEIDSEMPLKTKIAKFSRDIGIATFVCVIVIAFIGILRGMGIDAIFFTGTAIAVSLIPEGLPIVITLILARGVYRMAKRNALVKNMQAIEALGQARVIAVDKTGTITKNELMIERLYVDGSDFLITGSGYEPKGDIYLDNQLVEGVNHPEIIFAGKVAAFSANATVLFLEDGGIQINGDPTEAAQVVFARKIGFVKEELEEEEPLVFEEPFNYEHKFRVTLHKSVDNYMLTVVGEPETVIKYVTNIWSSEGERAISFLDRERIEEKIEEFSMAGLRVIMFATCISKDSRVDTDSLKNLTFVGLFGMTDVLREEVVESIDEAKRSGLRVVMITGDHLNTAKAIAKRAHIWQEGDRAITGAELLNLSRIGFEDTLSEVSVFGRVLPEHKLKIVEAYKSKGYIIGMTGDGVNDALSLRAAHLGLAMGSGGTEVAKEAADIVLLDNNFKSIIAAIEEGRSIYKTIKNVLLYLVSTSIGEFLAIAGAIALGLSLPIFPSQILWLNLVTDGFLVVALAFEPNTPLRLMPRSSPALFDKKRLSRSVMMGLVMMLGTLYIFYGPIQNGDSTAWTLSLTVLAVFQWFNIWNCRSDRESAFSNMFSNPYLVLALVVAILLHLFALHNPIMQSLLKTTPLDLNQWVQVLLVGSSILWVEEIRKFFVRRNKN
jgi:Ca2+-transporting ATPase